MHIKGQVKIICQIVIHKQFRNSLVLTQIIYMKMIIQIIILSMIDIFKKKLKLIYIFIYY